MTNLTRRQLFKSIFGAAAILALAKATAFKLSAPLLADLEFTKWMEWPPSYDEEEIEEYAAAMVDWAGGTMQEARDSLRRDRSDWGIYRLVGRYHGPSPHNGERAFATSYASPELLEDSKCDEMMFNWCYEALVETILCSMTT